MELFVLCHCHVADRRFDERSNMDSFEPLCTNSGMADFETET